MRIVKSVSVTLLVLSMNVIVLQSAENANGRSTSSLIKGARVRMEYCEGGGGGGRGIPNVFEVK